MTGIERVELDLLKVPLTTPYKLVFGNVAAFDTLLVTLTLDDGRSGIGEATILTGYTEETVDQCWQAACRIGADLPACPMAELDDRLAPWRDGSPFTAAAFATALDMALGHATLRPDGAAVALLAILNETDAPAMESELERLLAAGYRTVKVKVGWDVAADLRRVRRVQNALRKRAAIRLDANQGFSRDDGCAFVRGLDPDGIELFEQPCAAGDWDAAVAVKRAANVPMMLDESIYTIDDVDKAAALGAADIVKLKLMKLGSIDKLEAGLARARALGLGTVLGNGVATEIGCWMEACVATKMVTTAGEMNGFLKQKRSLLTLPLRVEAGYLRWPAGFAPALDAEAVATARVARKDFRVRAAVGVAAQ